MIPSELWKKLELEGAIRNAKVKQALEKVKRDHYVPESYRKYAYADTPLPIGFGQTISAPHMVALMSSLLRVVPGQKVLEVGAGSGYQAAIILELLKGKGQYFGVERLKGLVEFAKSNLKGDGYKGFVLVKGDGSKGFEKHAPFDRIIVSASAKNMPKKLRNQLKVGGLMLVPVGNELIQVRRKSKKTYEESVMEYVNFVPLIEE